MGELRIMGQAGDVKVIWDPTNADEVDAAKTQFESLTAKKFMAFSVKKKGGQGSRVKSFDRNAGKLIMIPPLVGG